MIRDPSPVRTPAQVRAGNKRLGVVLFAATVVFFIVAIVHQWIASTR